MTYLNALAVHEEFGNEIRHCPVDIDVMHELLHHGLHGRQWLDEHALAEKALELEVHDTRPDLEYSHNGQNVQGRFKV